MAITLLVNTGSTSVQTALVTTATDLSRVATAPEMVFGDTRDIAVKFLSGDNTFESWSGQNNYSVKIGIGPSGGVPTSGTFTISDGSVSTASLDFNATAAAVQTALNALNAGAGPQSGTVMVTKPAAGVYSVRWDAVGARTPLTVDVGSLEPDSAATITETTAGDGSTREEQLIRIVRQPATMVELDSADVIANGWSGVIDLDTVGCLKLMAGADSVSTSLEVEVTDDSGNRRTYVQTPVVLRNETLDEYASSSPSFSQSATLEEVFTYQEIATIATAGNTDITIGTKMRQHTVNIESVTGGSGAYTRTLTLPVANAAEGQRVSIVASIVNSTNPTLEVRNATSGGTLLTSVTGDGTAMVFAGEYTYNGTAWVEAGGSIL